MTEDNGRIDRTARLRWVSIEKMKVNPIAQRDLRQHRVDHLAAEFDLEQIGTPTVNARDGFFYIIDGQHRVEALRQIGWGDQQIQCWTYEGLSEEEEADRFLKLNDTLTVDVFSRYRAAVAAGREMECDIDRIVRSVGMKVSLDATDGSVSAVGTLKRVYQRAGASVLSRTLRIIRDAYGDAGLVAPVIDGIGLVCQRYNGTLDDAVAVERLAKARGQASGLLGKAENIRRQTGNQKGQCVAAAAVEFINVGRGGKKLPSWWREAA